MSQTADLGHLYQLEQILSLRSILDEQCDRDTILDDSLTDAEVPCIESQKLSTSCTGEPHDRSVTPFDPGGKIESSIQKDDENKDQDNKNSEPQQNVPSRTISDSVKCDSNDVNSVSTGTNEIFSYASTSCGRCIVFIAFTGNRGNQIPQLGSIILKPGLESSSRDHGLPTNKIVDDASVEDKISTNLHLSAYHVSWFDHGDSSADFLTCVTISERKNICLVSCRDGSLYRLPLHIIFPGFQPSCSSSDLPDDEPAKVNGISQLLATKFTKIPFEVFAIPKPLIYRRAHPTALIIWSSNEFTVAVVGTSQGNMVAVDLKSGNEVSFLKLIIF